MSEKSDNGKSDFIVIGGGIAGLMSAVTLFRRGHSVKVIDAGYPPASAAGAGILSALPPWQCPDPYATLIAENNKRLNSIVYESEHISGGDCELQRPGMLVLSDQMPRALPSTATVAPTHWLAPLLAREYANGIWMPAVRKIRARNFTSCLREMLRKQGVAFVNGAVRLQYDKNTITGAKMQNGETLTAAHYILCAGARAGELCPPPSPPVKPMRGQLLLYHSDKPLMCIVYSCAEEIYLAPHGDGAILAGSSFEDAGLDDRPAAAIQQELHQKAAKIFPPLHNAVAVNSWSGLRPCLPDDMPCIDTHPHYKNLHLNAGYGRYGIAAAYAGSQHLLKVMETPGAPNPFAFREWTPRD